MKKTKVISGKNLPVHPPYTFTAVAFLLCDRFHAPGWVWGVVGTLFALLWAVYIAARCLSEPVDIFDK